jgi:regulator of replication initiation timing
MESTITQILEQIEIREKKSKNRAIALTLIPVVAAIILIIYTSKKIISSQVELNSIEKRIKQASNEVNIAQTELKEVKSFNNKLIQQNNSLKLKNDSLSNSLTESVATLGKAMSVTTEFKKFIDRMEPYLRTQQEASFFINFRMLNDKIIGNYNALSKTISQLPKLDDTTNYIVIVASSRSLFDLRQGVGRLTAIYGRDQVAIYQDGKGNYALSVLGNTTFTRAYRLNVELRDKYGYSGAYFSGASNWGTNYLVSK